MRELPFEVSIPPILSVKKNGHWARYIKNLRPRYNTGVLIRAILSILFLVVSLSLFSQQGPKDVERLIQAKKYGSAEQILKEQLQKGWDRELRDKLGEVYGYQNKWDHAIAVYRELTGDYPEVAEYAFKYGGVLARKAQESNKLLALTLVGRIKRNLKRAVALDPNYLEAHWALVDLYVSLPGIVGGSIPEAFHYSERIKRISLVDGYLAKGYIHEYNDSPKKAKRNYFRALDLLDSIVPPGRNQLNYQIGKVCGDLGVELDLGLKHMKLYIGRYTALDGVPLKWAYFRMARLYRKKGDGPNAQNWITKALRLDKSFEPALREQLEIKILVRKNL